METVLITQNINNRRKTYDCEIDYSKICLIKRNAKHKYSSQVSSKIQLSETPHQRETNQIMYSRNKLTCFCKTQALTERNFQTDYKT